MAIPKYRIILEKVVGVALVLFDRASTFAPTDVDVTTSATLIKAASKSRRKVRIQNLSNSAQLYLGDSTVTTSTGWRVVAGGDWEEDRTTAAIYGIASAGTIDTRVVEM